MSKSLKELLKSVGDYDLSTDDDVDEIARRLRKLDEHELLMSKHGYDHVSLDIVRRILDGGEA